VKKFDKEMYAKKVIVLDKSTPSFEAARTLNEKKIGCALVSNGKGEMIGIVTDRDLACGILGEKLDPQTPISEVMATNLKFIFENDSFTDALKVMQRYGVRRVPVFRVSDSGSQRCVGIYTLDDFILWGDVQLADLRPIVKKQVNPIRKPRPMPTERKILHREQKLNQFNKIIAREIGLERELSEKIIFFLLKHFLHQVPLFVSRKFISQLPILIQEDFFSNHEWPKSNEDMDSMQIELYQRYGIRKEKFKRILPAFWRGLEAATGGGSRRVLFEHLPEDFQQAVREEKISAISESFLEMKDYSNYFLH
jgi:CBS domain-containing protein